MLSVLLVQPQLAKQGIAHRFAQAVPQAVHVERVVVAICIAVVVSVVIAVIIARSAGDDIAPGRFTPASNRNYARYPNRFNIV